MRRSFRSPAGSRFRGVFISLLAICASYDSARGVTVEDVVSGWKKHAAAIQSLQYECELTRTELLNRNGSNDPFGAEANNGAKKELMALKSDLSFNIDGQDLACLRVAEFWDDDARGPRIQTQRHVFDGKQNLDLYLSSHAPMGFINDAKAPSESLINHIELDSLWLAYSPLRFLESQKDLPLSKMRIAEQEMTCGESKCRELSIQCGPNNDVTFMLHVDAKADHRPLRWSMLHQGFPRRETVLQYDPSDETGWNLSKYSASIFDRDGEVSLSIVGVVKKRRVNQALDKAVFTIDYPDGTHIKKNEDYFIQKAGKLHRVEQKQFGVLPPSSEL